VEEAVAQPQSTEAGQMFDEGDDWDDDDQEDEKEADDEDWGDEDDNETNEWLTDEPSSTPTSNPKKVQLKSDKSKINLSTKFSPKDSPPQKTFKPFLPYYIYVETESEIYKDSALNDDSDEDDGSYCGSLASNSMIEDQMSAGFDEQSQGDGMETISLNLKNLSTSEKSDKTDLGQISGTEKYEKLKVAHGDNQNFTFIEYIRNMPEQILRYSSTRSISHAIAFNEKSKNWLKNFEKKVNFL